jgi:DNA-binding CsgD family transcriptional regulator
MSARLRSAPAGTLVDAIYEAAFSPENWIDVLAKVGAAGGSASGLLMVFDQTRPVQFRATAIVHDIIQTAARATGQPNQRAAFTLKNPFTGFARMSEYFPPQLFIEDPGHARRLAVGLDSEASAVIPMPTGEMVVFSFDRWQREGPHGAKDLASLNAFYPHLARSALIASRLGLERAVSATSTLQMIGLPAAVLTRSGRVLASNSFFDALPEVFLPRAFDRLAVADPRADRLFQQALDPTERTIGSIPIAETEGRPPCVLHLLPLRRNAHDLFLGGRYSDRRDDPEASSVTPSPTVLASLFDLTQSEVSFASALTGGLTVREASRKCGVTESSGRTYLARIFAKTGTHRQTELMALLASTHPFDR